MAQKIIDTSTFEIVQLDPAAPAPATVYTFQVPPNTVIQPIGVMFTLATDANVANRRVYIQAGPPGVPWARVMSSVDQIANLTMYYYWILGPIEPFYSVPMNQAQFQLFSEVYLYPGDYLSIAIYDTQVGDQLDDIHIGYKRWILA